VLMADNVRFQKTESWNRMAEAHTMMTMNTKQHLGTLNELEMWANAQRDGRPAEYRWRPLFNAAKFG